MDELIVIYVSDDGVFFFVNYNVCHNFYFLNMNLSKYFLIKNVSKKRKAKIMFGFYIFYLMKKEIFQSDDFLRI